MDRLDSDPELIYYFEKTELKALKKNELLSES